MKKNIALRRASGLMLSCLLSTCVISGTFAKYTTSNNAEDSARVAKWGVTVEVTGNEAFAEKYNNTADAAGTKVVSSVSGENVLAPGTNGTLATYAITGTPEVAVNVTKTAALTLTGWDYDPDADGEQFYCPIVFKVGGTTIDGTTYDSAAELEAAVEAIFNENVDKNANVNLAENATMTWEWAFDGDDVKDTALGNLATAPTIEFSLEITVTQVD